MAYTKYSLTPGSNTAAPPDGAPEGMLPSAVNDTMRDMMAQIRDCGDGIRGGTYTMTAPVITGGTINGTTIGATTASTGKFSTLTNAALTSGRVTYAGTAGLLQDDADFTFNGTTVTMANDASISGLTVGKGGGSGGNNSVFGSFAAAGFTTAFNNSAFGQASLLSTTTGGSNSAFGSDALRLNTTGTSNTAIGWSALYNNTTASNNTAVGYQAGYSNTTGEENVCIGQSAGYSNTTGSYSVYVGRIAGYSTTGIFNTFVGMASGEAVTSGTRNTIVGRFSGNQGGLDIRTASNYIVLSDGDGNPRAYFDGSGNFHPKVVPTTALSANAYIDSTSDNRLYRSTSALKYKQDVRDLPSIDINKFRPVVYKSKCENDDQTKDHFGIIADEVAEAGITELVSYGAEGEVEGFQYERLTVVLLKAVQELKAEVDSLKQQLGK